MARKTKNPPSETDVLLTNYIDQTLGNTGKIGWSSEEVSGMVQEVMKLFSELFAPVSIGVRTIAKTVRILDLS